MKTIFIRTVVTALLIFCGTSCLACLICEDQLSPDEASLERLIREKGKEAIPALRDILCCTDRTPIRLKIIAARELGKFQDRKSLPILENILMEIMDPESDSDFGVGTSAHTLRYAAGRALARMGETSAGGTIRKNWRDLPPQRQEELPSLFFSLGLERLQQAQLEILKNAGHPRVEFQVMVELRRSGDRKAIPAVESAIKRWEALLEKRKSRGEDGSFLPRMIHYGRGTLRALRRR